RVRLQGEEAVVRLPVAVEIRGEDQRGHALILLGKCAGCWYRRPRFVVLSLEARDVQQHRGDRPRPEGRCPASPPPEGRGPPRRPPRTHPEVAARRRPSARRRRGPLRAASALTIRS